MVDTLKTAIRLMCKAHPAGRLGMAYDLGMTIDQFHNHLYRKCQSRFFTVDELMKMEDLSGTNYLAEHFASRRRLTLVDIPSMQNVDKVDLFDIELKTDAADGELASAKLAAVSDGVIDSHEHKNLSELFHKKIRHQIHGFMGFLALYGVGVSDHSVDMFVASNRKADVAGMHFEAPEA
ncbi:MAG: YmfL family putative regulatory protein [Pantoea sp.]|uniref:YmfL family putative regulatory protein n=1 Tax=Pantoea sp. TaxID=69393 RepID=UPI0023A49003|nr:YmfL family putative regulatory protein [Pantoea sp.]MDE1188229.1 YmfL family putative regulatory protein [Pantoea sp.]